jgi:hypothetical protein
MIDSKGGAFGFDCCLAAPKFRVFQQPASAETSEEYLPCRSEVAMRSIFQALPSHTARLSRTDG